MKMRNVFLAFALTLIASFSFTATTFATTADVPVIEDGINGIIDDLVLDNGVVIITASASGTMTLSLVNASGQKIWNTKTDEEVVTIPTNGLRSGTYTLIATAGQQTDMRTFYIQGKVQQSVRQVNRLRTNNTQN